MHPSHKHLTPARDRKIIANNRGASLIEFVAVVPVLLLLVCAGIEYGWYFVRYEALSRAVSITAASIQGDPNPSADDSTLEALAQGNGSGIINFFVGTSGYTNESYICAVSYAALADAQSGSCGINTTKGHPQWDITTPSGVAAGAPYYVAIKAYAAPMSLTGFVSKILPQGTTINQTAVVEVLASASTTPTTVMTTSDIYLGTLGYNDGKNGVTTIGGGSSGKGTPSDPYLWTASINLSSYSVPSNATAVLIMAVAADGAEGGGPYGDYVDICQGSYGTGNPFGSTGSQTSAAYTSDSDCKQVIYWQANNNSGGIGQGEVWVPITGTTVTAVLSGVYNTGSVASSGQEWTSLYLEGWMTGTTSSSR